MRDRFQVLAFLFSLVLHGAMASFLMLPSAKVSEKEPFTLYIEWEGPFQPHAVIASPQRGRSNPEKSLTSTLDCDIANAPRNDDGGADKKSSSRAYSHKREEMGVAIQKGSKKLDCHVSNTPGVCPRERGERRVGVPLPVCDRAFQDQSIKKTYQPMPKYPWVCRKRGQEGCVSLLVQTNGEGRVIRASLHKSSGYSSLDQSALNAVKTWVFTDNASQKILSFSFRLKG